jgi:hypothetical protein
MNFSAFEFAGKHEQTRRERFFAEMDRVARWSCSSHKVGGGRKTQRCSLENFGLVEPGTAGDR